MDNIGDLFRGRSMGFILLGAGLVLALFTFISFNGVQKDMVKREQALSAQYQDNQNELSAYISTIKESLGVADRNTDALDQVLQDAVKGRYENGEQGQGGELFSAMVEAYPELDSVSLPYQKVQDAVTSGRAAYKNKQTKLLDMLREYDTWRQSGYIHSAMADMVGAPSDNLVARTGTATERGQDALDRMYQIVLTQDAVDAYVDGTMEPLDLGPSDE